MPKIFKHLRMLLAGCFIFFNISIQAQLPSISSFSPTSAGIYNYVTITGSNFTTITSVSFGGVPALSFFVLSSSTIVAQVGNGASGDITVTSTSGLVSKPNFVFVPRPVITGFSPATGGLGTVVTITGHYFTNTSSVSFGNINVQSFTVVSDSVITAVLGAGESGFVFVNTAVGGVGSSTGIFIHTAPTVNSFTPTSGPGGTAITIKGTNFTGATSVSIGGIPVTSFIVDSATGISAIVAPGSADLIVVSTPLGIGSLGSFNKTKINSFSPFQGKTGDTISIKGYNFTTATAVTFGNVPAASFTLIGDTLIKAIVGNGNSGAVSITTSSFGTASQSYFSYFQTTPQIFACNPAIGGPGTILTIRGKFFTGVSSVNLGGTAVASYNIVSDSLITAVVGSGSSGYINMINPSGSSSASTIFTYSIKPLIFSFTPASGSVGTVVDIAGVNFANSITGNKVYFGPVAGTIIAASSNSIKVTAPVGADNTALTVITNGKVIRAKKPFLITFPGDTAFTASSFAPKIDSATGYLSYGLATGDFDDDGKPDMAIANYGDNNIGVYRNNSTNGAIAFAPKQLFASSTGPRKLVVGDVNGDGKLDIAAASLSGISVFKNTSVTGTISFAPTYTTSTGTGNQDIAMADFDNDGRPDLVTPNGVNFTTTLFKNTSTAGNISFSGVDLGGSHPVSIAAADLNDDGKPDFMVANALDASTPAGFLYIYKNTSTGEGSFAFQSSTYYFSPNNISDITVGDLDGDGKPDIAVTDNDNAKIYIARNTSTNGNITFAPFITLNSISILARINMADLNGDKKMELIVSNSNSVSAVYKNNSTAGVLSFSPYVTYYGGFASCLSDINGDGKPEMIFTGLFGTTVSILKNQIGPNIKTLCPSISGTTIYSNLTGSSYQWQADTGTGFINIANNSNYSGTNSPTLQLSSIPSSWYGYKYRNLVDAVNYSDTIELRVSNTWTGAVNNQWENPANWSCGTVPDGFTDVIVNFGTIVVNSNVSIKSLSIQPGASVAVNTGYTLTVN